MGGLRGNVLGVVIALVWKFEAYADSPGDCVNLRVGSKSVGVMASSLGIGEKYICPSWTPVEPGVHHYPITAASQTSILENAVSTRLSKAV